MLDIKKIYNELKGIKDIVEVNRGATEDALTYYLKDIQVIRGIEEKLGWLPYEGNILYFNTLYDSNMKKVGTINRLRIERTELIEGNNPEEDYYETTERYDISLDEIK